MGELIKMQIISFEDNTFLKKHDTITLQINPSTLKYSLGLSYISDKSVGKSNSEIKYDRSNKTTLNFDFIFDDTGIVPNPEKKSLVEMISHLEDVVYNINSDTHEPNYLQVNWGSFLFNGRMSSLSYDYSLFRPDGSPLRVKTSMSIEGYMNKLQESKTVCRLSSDLSRLVTLKAGESIAHLCNQIYGDSSYCLEVADYNKLGDFRNVQIGTQLMFPPLNSNGRVSE